MENLIASLIGLIVAILMSILIINIGKLKMYIYRKKKEEKHRHWYLLDFSWRVGLPLLFVYLGFILPIDIMCHLSEKGIISNLRHSIDFYSYSFIISFFFLIFLLIKIGKIKTTKKLF